MNPIALMMIMLGALLLLLGMVLVGKRVKGAGIVISLLGLGAMAFPFLVSFYLAAPTR
jgi:hypothetical protein